MTGCISQSALSFVQSAMFRLSSSSASATLICPKMSPFFTFSFEVCAIRLSMVASCALVSTPLIFSASALFFSIKDARTLGDIAVMEKIVANAVSDGINAGMDYKDIYKLAKSRCELAVPAIGLK